MFDRQGERSLFQGFFELRKQTYGALWIHQAGEEECVSNSKAVLARLDA
jgi:hypothetical protein